MKQRGQALVFCLQKLGYLTQEKRNYLLTYPDSAEKNLQQWLSSEQMCILRILFCKYTLWQCAAQEKYITKEQFAHLANSELIELQQKKVKLSLKNIVLADIPHLFWCQVIEKFSSLNFFNHKEVQILAELLCSLDKSYSKIISKNFSQYQISQKNPSEITSQSVSRSEIVSENAFHSEIVPENASHSEISESMSQLRNLIKESALPEHFGPYQIMEEIGAGGMGVVYKAYHSKLERTVAIKMMLSQKDTSPTNRNRFMMEAKNMAKLQHPNIVKVYDVGQREEGDYIVMDFIEGESLADLLDVTQLSVRSSLQILKKSALAMAYAHSKNIIHRDLKPDNILIAQESKEPLITDFGLAKDTKSKEKLTQTGMIIGTPEYMAPEQISDMFGKISPLADIYALGVVMYEMLTGKRPFSAKNSVNVLYKICNEEMIALCRRNPKLAPELEVICHKAMARCPEKRYANSQELAQDIEHFLNGEAIMAQPPSFIEKSLRYIKRHKVTLAILLVLISFLISNATIKWYKKRLKINSTLAQVEKFLTTTTTAKKLESKYPKQGFYHETSIKEEEERVALLKKYSQIRSHMEKVFSQTPHSQAKKYLFLLEKEIGLLALGGKNYLLSELSFTRCQTFGNPKEAKKLLGLVQIKRKEEKENQIKRLQEIIAVLKKGPKPAILDDQITEVLQMRGSHITKALIRFLHHPNEWPRLMAIETLGKRKDKETKVDGKNAAVWLLERLQTLNHQKAFAETYTIVWALGRLKVVQAQPLVLSIRKKFGSRSKFWNDTQIPYYWLSGIEKQEDPKTLAQAKKNMSKKNYWEAIHECSKMIENKSDYSQAYEIRGIAYQKIGKLNLALSDINKVISLTPKRYEAYVVRARIYIQQKKFTQAQKDYDMAIKLNPLDSLTYYLRGNFWYKKKNIHKALMDFTMAISINPHTSLPYIQRALVYQELKKYDKAQEDYQKAIKLDPKHFGLYINRGIGYLARGKLQKALADFSFSIQLNQKNPNAYYNRAIAYMRLHNNKQALKDFAKVVELNPKNSNAYCARGSIYAKKGMVEKAMHEYSIAIKRSPNNAMAYFQRGQLLRLQGKEKQAAIDLKKFLQLSPQAPNNKAIRAFVARFSHGQ